MQSLWMLFAAFMFSVMGVGVKLASASYSTAEIVGFRGLVGAVFLFALVQIRGGTFKTTLPWHHAWRGFIGVVSLWMWFVSFAKLPLAMAVTLNNTAPIWFAAILLIAGMWTRTRRADWSLVLTILVSFSGVVLLMQPAIDGDQWHDALVALASGALSALAYLQVRKLGQMGEPEYRVVFYFSLISAIAGFGVSLINPSLEQPMHWMRHSWSGIGLLLLIGISATVAQVAMTRAYRYGNPLVTANLQYAGIVFASLWGIVLWNDRLGWLGWLGITVILASGIVATFLLGRPEERGAPAPDKVIANEV